MKVDLPTPGAPEMPMRIARPVRGKNGRKQRFRRILISGPRRFNERDGTRQGPAVAGDQRFRHFLVWFNRRTSAWTLS